MIIQANFQKVINFDFIFPEIRGNDHLLLNQVEEEDKDYNNDHSEELKLNEKNRKSQDAAVLELVDNELDSNPHQWLFADGMHKL